MAVVAISDSILTDIADAIRSKNGTENTYKPAQMPDAIEAISGGGITPTGTIEITQNGVVDVTNYASADVDVPTGSTPVINSLSVTENGTYTAPSGVDGYSPVTVNVPVPPNIGAFPSYTLSEAFNALATGAYQTGTVTLTSYYSTSSESEFCDTGYAGTLGGILIFDLANPSGTDINMGLSAALGIFSANNSTTSNQSETSRGFCRAGTSATTYMFNSTYMTSYRVNNGKLYIRPKNASLANTYFQTGHTYRWIAWADPGR